MTLGGSSNHFRRSCLEQAGGWDAWNVTEDADLGIRFARLGLHVRHLASDTLEDAPDADAAGPDPEMVLTDANRVERISAILPRIEDLVRREQTNSGVGAEGTVLIGFSQGGTAALEAVKQYPGLAGAVVAYSARFAQLPLAGSSIRARVHLVHGEHDTIVSLRLLQGIYEGRKATLH